MSWQDKLRQVEPYVAGEQPKINNMIKLNTNENPYGPCKQIKDILKEIDIEKLKLYPNSDGEELRHALAKYHGLKDEQVFLGNGSDEVYKETEESHSMHACSALHVTDKSADCKSG